MATKVRIKRSTTAEPSTLDGGELAYTSLNDVLYIGSPATGNAVTAIGGKRFPGVLTANQALVANASSSIDKVIVANLVPTNIWANGATGTAGDVLFSNGIGVYWKAPSPGVAGSDTQVQFNDGGSLAGDAGLTYNKTTDSLSSNNFYAVSVVNAATLSVGTSTVANSTGVYTGVVNAASHTVGTAFTANSSLVNAAAINIVGQTNTATFFATTSANVGANIQVTTTSITITGNTSTAPTLALTSNSTGSGLTVGNSSVTGAPSLNIANSAGNTVINTTAIGTSWNLRANSSGVYHTGTMNAASHTVGTAFIANSTGAYHTGTMNAASHTVGTSTIANSTGVYTGVVNGATLSVGSSVVANSSRFVIGTGVGLQANGGIGTAGQVLTSNATTVYWSTPTTGTVTSVASGNGLTGGPITSTGTLSVVANNGIVANSSGVFVNANNGIVANSSGVFALANTSSGLIANSSGIHAKVSPTVILDGSGNLAVNSAALSFVDLTVSGNLVVQGDLVSLNVATLAVEDPLIVLAKDQNNTAIYTDAVDIGFFGTYGNTQVGNNKFTGLFRDQSDSGIYKLFDGAIPVPTTTVDTTNVNFAFATLQSYLKSSGLTTNATHVAITANSTVNVTITANSLTLATALAATSGGTGQSTYAVGDLLVGGATNTLTKLTLGADGKVLQSSGTTVVYDDIDGGTF